jgi:hypothetical protein
MEGDHDKNNQAPQVLQRQTGCGIADFLNSRAIRRMGCVELIVSDRLTKPRSLISELIVAPRQDS